jgi:hypothetical protein
VLNRAEKVPDLVWLPDFPSRSWAFGRPNVVCRIVDDVLPGDRIDKGPVNQRVDIAHRLRCKPGWCRFSSDAGPVAAHRGSRCMDSRIARGGNVTGSWCFSSGYLV